MRNHKNGKPFTRKATTKTPKGSTEIRLRKELKYLREANKELIKQLWTQKDEHAEYAQKTDEIIRLFQVNDQLRKRIDEKKDEIIAILAATNPDGLLCITEDGIALNCLQ